MSKINWTDEEIDAMSLTELELITIFDSDEADGCKEYNLQCYRERLAQRTKSTTFRH